MFRIRYRYNSSLFVIASSLIFKKSSNQSKSTPQDTSVDLPRTPFKNLNCTGFECIRESCMINLSASSSFLKYTLYYYSELTERYGKHIKSMIEILEEFKRFEGAAQIQENIWTNYVNSRIQLNEMKNELLRLRLLLSTIDRLVTESIDACYQTHDETVTQLVSNELIQSKLIMEQNQKFIQNNDLMLTSEQIKLFDKRIDDDEINKPEK